MGIAVTSVTKRKGKTCCSGHHASFNLKKLNMTTSRTDLNIRGFELQI